MAEEEFVVVFSNATAIYQLEKKGNGCAKGWCARRGSLQDRLPVKFQDVKFTDPKIRHEIFVRIDIAFILLKLPYCYYYKRVLILANIGDLVITAKFCACY